MEILGIKSITTYEIGTNKKMNVCIDRFETFTIIATESHIYFEHTEKPDAKTLIFGYKIANAITPHETFRASDINLTHNVLIEFDDGFVLNSSDDLSIFDLLTRNLGQKYHNVVISRNDLGTSFITIFLVTNEMLQFLSYYHLERKKGYHSHSNDTICDFGYVNSSTRGRIQYSFYTYLMSGKHVRGMINNVGDTYTYGNKKFILVEDKKKVDLYRTKYRFLHNL